MRRLADRFTGAVCYAYACAYACALVENVAPIKGGKRVSEVIMGNKKFLKSKTKIREALFAQGDLAQKSAAPPHISDPVFCLLGCSR